MKNVPNLRFQEFSGDWEKKRFSKYIKLYRGSSPRPIQSYLTSGEGVNWIKIGDAKDVNNYILDKVSEKITYEGSLKSRKVDIGELILANSMSFGATYMLGIQGCIYDGWFVLREYEQYFNKLFLLQQLNSDFLQKQYKKLSTGGVVQNISSDIVYSTKLCCPSLQEQEKIASFFSLIDKKIELQTEKVEELKNYKKGIMQKIFSQELRFKDENGNDYPEWEEVCLYQIGSTYTGLSGKTKEDFGFGNGSFVTYMNVFSNTLAKPIVEQVNVSEKENQNLVLKGDLLFTTSSETPNEVGMVSCWNYEMRNLHLNSFCFGYRLYNSDSYLPIFLAYMLRSGKYRKKISILAQGSTRYNISKTELMKMKVQCPAVEEQQKIVSLLLGLESKLEHEQSKLNEFIQYKQGLLQQMFI